MPDDVAARMDAVLADLAAETSSEPDGPQQSVTPAPLHPVVVSLDVRRRRRAAGMLVAAAAIVVGGVVMAQHLPTSTSQSNATAAEDRGSSAGDSLTVPSTAPVTPRATRHPEAAKLRFGRVVVSPQRFTTDALAARRLLQKRVTADSSFSALSQTRLGCAAPAVGEEGVPPPAASPPHTQPRLGCAAPAVPGKRVGATYEGAPAVLVFHAPESGSQVVDLYVCGSPEPVRSATFPSP